MPWRSRRIPRSRATAAAIEVFGWNGTDWVPRDPQPKINFGVLAGTVCDERGHHDVDGVGDHHCSAVAAARSRKCPRSADPPGVTSSNLRRWPTRRRLPRRQHRGAGSALKESGSRAFVVELREDALVDFSAAVTLSD